MIVCDRRPEMACYGPPLPWLDKPRGDAHDRRARPRERGGGRRLRRLSRLRGRRPALAAAEGGAQADRDSRRAPVVVRVRRPAGLARAVDRSPRVAPACGHPRYLRLRASPTSSRSPSNELWLAAVEHRWDIVPVVIQDPTWEQSFPDVSGIVVPLARSTDRSADAGSAPREGGRAAKGAQRKRACGRVLETFRLLDIDPVVVSSSDRSEILSTFLVWSDLRRTQARNRGLTRWDDVDFRRSAWRPSWCLLRPSSCSPTLARDDGPTEQPRGETPPEIEAEATIAPRPVLFGDTVRASVDVMLDTERVDPDSVRVAADFSPWEVIGRPERRIAATDEQAHVRSTFVLRCLSGACVPAGQSGLYEFPEGRVSFTRRGGRLDESSIAVRLPAVRVYSRLTDVTLVDDSRPSVPWRADLLSLPTPRFFQGRCRGPSEQSALVRTLAGRRRLTSGRVIPPRAQSASWPSFSLLLWRWPPAHSGSRWRRGLGVSPHHRLHRRRLRPSPCSVRSSRRSSFWSSRFGMTESRINAVPSSLSPRSWKPPRGAITRLRMPHGGLRGRRLLHPSTRRLSLRRGFALPSS